jgi:hypothetical protein
MIKPTSETARRGRGRPKGSGIDDDARLSAIKSLLAGDPKLKPTTAIKQVGISDPSAVRRLREKLRASPQRSATNTGLIKTKTVRDRQPAAALATPREDAVTAEVPAPQPEPTAFISKHPPLAAETEKRTREALLLAAYLEAMAKAPPSTPQPTTPAPTTAEPQKSDPRRPPTPEPGEANKEPRTEPRQEQQAPFTFPGMPPFLQPFRQPTPPPQTGSQTQHLEGMKLAVEAMTSMTKLQLHITENAFSYSPLAMMLQGQALVGQMLLASFTGQLDSLKPKKPKS